MLRENLHRLGPVTILLLIAIAGAAAWWFASRVLLSLSITSLAAFLGINYDIINTNLYIAYDLAIRGYIVTALLIGWRLANARRHVSSRI